MIEVDLVVLVASLPNGDVLRMIMESLAHCQATANKLALTQPDWVVECLMFRGLDG